MDKIKKWIELLANVGIVVVCSLLGLAIITHGTLNLAALAGDKSSLQGSTLSGLPGYRWSDHQKTLVLYVRTGCHYCEASLPFYKRLSDLEKSDGLHAHLLAVMPDDPKSGTMELQYGGVAIEAVFKQPPGLMKITGTPTLLLVDANGRVKSVWVGQLSPQGEEDVISTANRNVKRSWYTLW